jgi:putative membrane protein
MTLDAMLAYFHFASIFLLVSMLAVELAVCTRDAGPADLLRLKKIDGVYGLAALLALATGAARLVWGAKGMGFYMKNPVFHAKIGLFVVMGLISIYPTVQFFRWARVMRDNAREMPDVAAIDRVRMALFVQLGLLACIPIMATLMARGIGAR